jgi:protein-S-isoprenylcysteine O-methyltransferase
MQQLRAFFPFGLHSSASYALTSFLLGAAFVGGLTSAFFVSGGFRLGMFVSFLAFFHFSEFLFVASYHPTTLSWDNFLLNHSPEYSTAVIVAFVEYFLESWLFPGLKDSYFLVGISTYRRRVA